MSYNYFNKSRQAARIEAMRYAKVKKINTDQCYNNEYVVESVHASIYGALKKGTPVFEVSDEIGVGESVDCNGKKFIKMYS